MRVAIAAGRPRVTHPALSDALITTVESTARRPHRRSTITPLTSAALIAANGKSGSRGVAPGTELLAISVLDRNFSANQPCNSVFWIHLGGVLGGPRVLCLSLGKMARSTIIADAIADAIVGRSDRCRGRGEVDEGSGCPSSPTAVAPQLASSRLAR